MRKRKNKFALDFGDGLLIQTVEELRENFSLKKIMEYFKNRRLVNWLEDRFYSDEADAIRAIKPTDQNAPQKICAALGVDYSEYAEELDDPETVAWRAERRERLKEFTNDEKIIKKIDYVAFDQEDLEDILRDPFLPNTIYLCENFFRFPSGMLRKTNIGYIGLGKVFAKIESQKPVDFKELNISFKNIRFVADEQEVELLNKAEEKAKEEIKKEQEKEKEKLAPKQKLPVLRLSDTQMILADSISPVAVFQTAVRFKSRISIRHEGRLIDAKGLNILKVVGLTKGVRVTVNAEGFDAKEAIETFADLWKNGWQKPDKK